MAAIAVAETPTQRLRAAASALAEAVRLECIEPDGPLGVWVKAQHLMLSAMADSADHQVGVVLETGKEMRKLAQAELENQRSAIKETQIALNIAKQTTSQMEIERARVENELIAQVVPKMISATKEALVIRERRFNRNMEWGRALGAGGLMLGLILFGYIWGTWADWGMSSRIEALGAAVRHCADTSPWRDDKGNRLCNIHDFSAQ